MEKAKKEPVIDTSNMIEFYRIQYKRMADNFMEFDRKLEAKLKEMSHTVAKATATSDGDLKKIEPMTAKNWMNVVIAKNRAQCMKCLDIIESIMNDGYVSCRCEAMSIDGGLDYIRRSGDERYIRELTEYKFKHQ